MNKSDTNMTISQMALLSAVMVCLFIGAMFWALAIDNIGRVVGVILMGIGLALVVPFALIRDVELVSRQNLRNNGRKIDAYIDAVQYDGGMRGVNYYHLELKDPNDETLCFMSDPIVGNGDAVAAMLESSRRLGPEKQLTVPVYIDRHNSKKYFVEASDDIEQFLQSKMANGRAVVKEAVQNNE